jgi:DNA-binding GntR family transcriptional regulator
MSKTMRPIRRPSLGEEAARVLRGMIIRGDLPPGDRLVEERLAKTLGVSRTPLREAFQRLEQKGLIEKRPRGGFVVRPLSIEEVEEAYGVREVLEAYAAELASRNCPPDVMSRLDHNVKEFNEALEQGDRPRLVALNAEFHSLLHQATDSRLLMNILAELEDIVERTSRVLVMEIPAAEWSAREHNELFAAIRDGAGATAAMLAAQHVRRGGDWIIDRMKNKDLEL